MAIRLFVGRKFKKEEEKKIYVSADFQCPVTGVPVILIWNEDTCVVTAKICDFVWTTWKEDNPLDSNEDLEKETNKWCHRFYGYATSFEEANDIAEKYDCWF